MSCDILYGFYTRRKMENRTYAIVLLDTVEDGRIETVLFLKVEITFSTIENFNWCRPR